MPSVTAATRWHTMYLGIDLAADPKRTGMAVLREDDGALVVESTAVGVSDAQIVQAVHEADGTGVDVPVGWPIRFAELVRDHAALKLKPPDSTDASWRRGLAMRTTDMEVWRRTGITPLSVSANLIAYPAFRWAGIEAKLRDEGVDTSRDGSGVVAEVYPAAALYRWGLPHRGYKGTKHAAVRQSLVESISKVFPAFEWRGFETLAIADDNVLDAVLAALVAQQIARGNCECPAADQRETARVEGWIWLPKLLD